MNILEKIPKYIYWGGMQVKIVYLGEHIIYEALIWIPLGSINVNGYSYFRSTIHFAIDTPIYKIARVDINTRGNQWCSWIELISYPASDYATLYECNGYAGYVKHFGNYTTEEGSTAVKSQYYPKWAICNYKLKSRYYTTYQNNANDISSNYAFSSFFHAETIRVDGVIKLVYVKEFDKPFYFSRMLHGINPTWYFIQVPATYTKKDTKLGSNY